MPGRQDAGPAAAAAEQPGRGRRAGLRWWQRPRNAAIMTSASAILGGLLGLIPTFLGGGGTVVVYQPRPGPPALTYTLTVAPRPGSDTIVTAKGKIVPAAHWAVFLVVKSTREAKDWSVSNATTPDRNGDFLVRVAVPAVAAPLWDGGALPVPACDGCYGRDRRLLEHYGAAALELIPGALRGAKH